MARDEGGRARVDQGFSLFSCNREDLRGLGDINRSVCDRPMGRAKCTF